MALSLLKLGICSGTLAERGILPARESKEADMRKMSLVLLVMVIAAMAGVAQAQDHAYVGASKCKMCHKVQFASWEQTSHAKALDAAKVRPTLRMTPANVPHATQPTTMKRWLEFSVRHVMAQALTSKK